MPMIEHISLPVRSYAASRAFYTRVLAPLGYTLHMEFPDAGGFMEGEHTSFWIVEGEPTASIHVAFRAESREAVRAFYEVALAAGATDNGAPGLRPNYSADYYAAFVLDLDGHNIEAVCFGE